MTKGVITLDYKERFVDRITKMLYKMKLFQTDGYYPITEEKTGEEVAAFICIKGSATIVRFLEWITDYRGKDGYKVTIDY